MLCVAPILILLMWLVLCMAFCSAYFAGASDRDEEAGADSQSQVNGVVSTEIAVRVLCVAFSIVFLVSAGMNYVC